MDLKAFGKTLKELRTTAHLTQETLVDQLAVFHDSENLETVPIEAQLVSKWERAYITKRGRKWPPQEQHVLYLIEVFAPYLTLEEAKVWAFQAGHRLEAANLQRIFSFEAFKSAPFFAFGKLLYEGVKGVAIRRGESYRAILNDLAEYLKFAPTTLAGWRCGEGLPQSGTLLKLAEEFVDNGNANQSWIEDFLNRGNYGSAQAIADAKHILFLREQQLLRHNRKIMLEKVRGFWVEGVLETSLTNICQIDVQFEERHDLVRDDLREAWTNIVQPSSQPNQLFPPETKIVDIFDQNRRSLLIVGKPGAGKTTMLLSLAREAINQARMDATQPIPAVFNLSSWTKEKGPIATWLIDELRDKYNDIREEIAKAWVEEDKLLILLDGLDEVTSEYRDLCVSEIDAFCQDHPTPIAICCRLEDYEALSSRLPVKGAVSLQSITPEQVDTCLADAGPEYAGVRKMLSNSLALQKLVDSPLMLNILAIAFQGDTSREWRETDTVDQIHKEIFAAYVEKMFNRIARTQKELYSKEQMIEWLTWLARRMRQHHESILLIERIQPSWLDYDIQRKLYTSISRLTVGQVFGLPFGLFFGLLSGFTFSEIFYDNFWQAQVSQIFSLFFWIIVGLIIGQMAGVVFAFLLERHATSDKINTVETIKWSWQVMQKKFFAGFRTGIMIGAVFAFVIICLGLLANDAGGGVLFGLMAFLIFGLSLGLIFGFLTGFENYELVLQDRIQPNQGIRQSRNNAIKVGVTSSLIGVPIGILILVFTIIIIIILNGGIRTRGEMALLAFIFFLGSLQFTVLGAVSGIFAGGIASLNLGGLAVIRHFILRLILYLSGCTPFKLTRFLDYATDLILLRKTGGSYIFIHPMLMDHFVREEDQV
jgi:transcriptional regulator with XRE-family HTH domain